MRILIIDDERRRAEALVAYFEQICAWSVELATDPEEALSALSNVIDGGPALDVIMLDIMMDPGSIVPAALSGGGKDTGLVLLGIIWDKMGHAGKNVPIIVFTARIDLEDLLQDRRVARYIQKPRTARELVAEIEAVVHGVAS